MATVKFFGNETVPLEMHKVRIVQKLSLPPVERRLEKITEAGNNTFLLQNDDVFLDMLTDSGVNAMSDQQQAAMMVADDSYAGSATYTRLEDKLREIFGMHYFLPTHQGRACEHILAKVFVTPGTVVPMNYHFTTTKAHITLQRRRGRGTGHRRRARSDQRPPVQGQHGHRQAARADRQSTAPTRSPSSGWRAGTNLIGGQPFSLANLRDVSKVCDEIRHHAGARRQPARRQPVFHQDPRGGTARTLSIREITRAHRGPLRHHLLLGAQARLRPRRRHLHPRPRRLYEKMRPLVPLYEGFLTYGGMSVREIEALAVGLEETMDEDMINQGPHFIGYMVEQLQERGVPVITPAGGLGCHSTPCASSTTCRSRNIRPARWRAALYIACGIRGMERGTLSEQREPDGTRGLRQYGAGAAGAAAPGVHPVAGQIRGRPDRLAVRTTAS